MKLLYTSSPSINKSLTVINITVITRTALDISNAMELVSPSHPTVSYIQKLKFQIKNCTVLKPRKYRSLRHPTFSPLVLAPAKGSTGSLPVGGLYYNLFVLHDYGDFN